MAGKLYTWGAAANGRLGNGTTTPDVLVPTQIGSDTDWDWLDNGGSFVLAIKDGKLFAWGAGGSGRLGTGGTADVTTPTQIGSNTDWQQVAAGGDFSLGIRGGKLFTWGNASFGVLGNGTTTPNVLVPTQIGTDTDWQWVGCTTGTSEKAAFAIKGGKLYSWGSNNNGMLGNGGVGATVLVPTEINSDTDWEKVTGGLNSIYAIKSGKLFAWGLNSNGQLGDGTLTRKNTPTQIGSNSDWQTVTGSNAQVVNSYVAFGIRDNKLFAWGSNTSGATGLNTTTGNTTTPTQVGTDTGWQVVAAGFQFGAGIKNGELFTWGLATNGRLGNGTTTPNVLVPTKIGSSNNWAFLDTGSNFVAALETATTPPVNTVAPAISGTAKVGQTLTTDDGTWTGTPTPTYTRQWQVSDDNGSSWSNISGATSSTYILTANEAGKIVRSKITATNDAGAVDAFSTATAEVTQDPTNTVAPAITGTVKVGNILTASTGTWQGHPTPTYAYQWEQNSGSGWSNISGATSSTYTLTANEASKTIRVKVTATNSEAVVDAFSSATTAVTQDPTNTVAPESFGYPLVGETFSTDNGTWQGYPTLTYTYQWQVSADEVNWSNISGATNSTFVATTNEISKFIRSKVTATNSESAVNAFSNSNGPVHELPEISAVTIDGLPAKVGEELTATATATAGYPEPDITYEWYRDDDGFEYIDDGANYTPTSADAGLVLKVIATVTNIEGDDSSEEVTEETLWAPANTSLPTISYPEFLEVGETLTADPGTWTGYPDPAEIGFTYQWQVSDDGENDWTNIEDATATTLYLGTEFGTKYVRVEVTSTTTAGSTTVYSAETGYISEDPSIIVSPILSGTTHYQEILTVDPGEWGGFPEADFEYSWEISLDGSEDWETLDGEEEDTITLGAETVGYYIRVYVTGTNPVGSASVHSNVLGPILRAAYLFDDPTITGDPRLLNTIETDDGSFGGFEEPTISYGWELSDDETIWEEIDGANSSSYIIPDDEDLIGKFIRSKATATNTVGSDIGYSNSLGPIDYPLQMPTFTTNPTLNIQYGIPSVNIEIESSHEGSGYPIPTPTYQWQIRPGALDPWENITGSTMATYTPVESDINKQLRLRVTLTNIAGTVTEYTEATFNVVPEFKEPSLVEPGVISSDAYINKLIKLIDFGEVDGYPIPVVELGSIEFEYSFNSDSEDPEWKTVSNFDTGDTEWLVSEDFAQAKIRAKITYSVPTGIFDDIVIYTNLSGEIIEQPYQQETFLPMANAKLNKIYSNPEVTGVPHDSEFLPTYTEKRIKWEGQSDAFIRTKMLKLINASTSVGGGTIDRYKETVVIIPKLTNIDHDDYINLTYDDKEYTWKVIEITDGNYDLGMPEIYRLVVEKA